MSDAYGDRSSTRSLRPGTQAVEGVQTQRSNDWYDISVTSNKDPRFVAGHVETGRPSTSDPAISTH